ncbi:sugar kinase [Advenella kashmirensis W13003]|uniref:Sugar kinase n=1 Tax=Advenella kashmirensis W13003 TaxID=1424334 RepID=V8QP89_9BURK|nr:D-glycero-beta-D-manno-heptose-7-phosphate kinase [Advenella kashmirensis]ETF01786.1 sugar kinase [Advenella kashmirensis W13003]
MPKFPIEKISQIRVLVVGDVMLDRYWFGEVDRISPEAPVPVVRVAKREDRLGGGANVARNIVALGGQVTLLGIVGDDEAGQQIARLADEGGIRAQLLPDPQMHTTLKMRVLGRQQQLIRIDFDYLPGEQTLQNLEQHYQRLLDEHDIVVLSDYAKGVLTHCAPLIEMARKRDKPVLVDPKGDEYDRYTGASLISPNRIEMQQAVGKWKTEDELTRSAQALRQRLELEALLITRSEQGMTLYTEAGRFHVDAAAHEVFDVSGAGDTVLATMAVTRAAGLDWQQSVEWANKAGGIVVGKLGTSIVSAEELT